MYENKNNISLSTLESFYQHIYKQLSTNVSMGTYILMQIFILKNMNVYVNVCMNLRTIFL